MPHQNERVELEITIIKYRAVLRQTVDELTKTRLEALIAELEKKLREMDE